MAFLVTCGSESSDEVPVEKSIDGVAAYMGYSDGEEIDLSKNEEMSGALKGKYFEDGKVSIYEFDPNSSYYEFWENEIWKEVFPICQVQILLKIWMIY